MIVRNSTLTVLGARPESSVTESTRLSLFCYAEKLSPSGPKSATKSMSGARIMMVLSSIRYFPAAFLAISLFAFAAVAQAPNLESMDIVMKSIPDGPIAKVNGSNVSSEDFISLYSIEIARLGIMAGGKKIEDSDRIIMGMRCIGILIEQELLTQEAQRRNLSVSDKELEDAWKQLRLELAQGQGDPVSEEEVIRKSGNSKDELNIRLKRNLMIDKVRDILSNESDVSVSDKEVKDFFDQNKDRFRRSDSCHIKQIFLRGDSDSDKKAKAREACEDALKRIQSGQNFEAVAKAVSNSPDSQSGGDFGTIPIKDLPPFYADAISTMQPGQLSNIIESEYGFHLVKLEEFFPGTEGSLDNVSEQIRTVLLEQKKSIAISKYCQNASDNGDVQMFIELEKMVATHPDRENLIKALGMN